MGTFLIRQGRNINLKGAARKDFSHMPLPSQVAVLPPDYRGLRPRLLVREGDSVKKGTPLLSDKNNPKIQIVSPASGSVLSIVRGEKRSLERVIIQTDDRQEGVSFKKYTIEEMRNLSRQQRIDHLLEAGLWPSIRQRPFSNVADPSAKPKSIFIQAMNTEPLALDMDFILSNKEALFQTGIDIIKKLTDGKVHLCTDQNARSKALTEATNVEIHRFSGPHPAGNVSTHIHYVDPINKGDIVWYIGAQDVLRVASLFLDGIYPSRRYVALTGEGIITRTYVETVIGAGLRDLLKGNVAEGELRHISGGVLTGKDVGKDGFLCFYDSQVTVIPQGGKRELLGWIRPGFDKYSFSKTFASSFLPPREASLDTDTRGSNRPIVLNNVYDDLVPLDILTFFLIRAVISGDIDEAEKLGILECDEEDFALCSFGCPSKTDVGAIIRQGLDMIEKEG